MSARCWARAASWKVAKDGNDLGAFEAYVSLTSPGVLAMCWTAGVLDAVLCRSVIPRVVSTDDYASSTSKAWD